MPDLIPEFRRIVLEAQPTWWIMENSPHAYAPLEPCHTLTLDTAWLGERQARRRVFWSSHPLSVDVPALLPVDAGTERAVSSQGAVRWRDSGAAERRRTLGDMLELQGFPRDMLDHQPFTLAAAKKMVGNGVPYAMGRAVARAIRRATHPTDRSESDE
jgi:DNA (cytosine-5)-methyltransferase 1